MGAKTCEVCKEAQSKYKCPSCLVPYCSLACYKKHKEIPCSKPEIPSEEKVYPASAPVNKKPSHINEPTEVLKVSQLQSIASSSEIRDLLKDEKLQKQVCNIGSSADAENELDKAMEDETFRLLADKILSTIDP